MSSIVEFLKDRHKSETCYIVGKGPSLGHLTADYFGVGPVITMNESILAVQELGLNNLIYSLQKDGCGILSEHSECIVQAPNYQQMIRPKNNISVFLQGGYADYCLADYPNRYVFDLYEDFGFSTPQTVSLRIAIAIAKLMDVLNIVLLCCDSLATGNLDTYSFGNPIADISQGSYIHAVPLVEKDLASIPHSFVTPGRIS